MVLQDRHATIRKYHMAYLFPMTLDDLEGHSRNATSAASSACSSSTLQHIGQSRVQRPTRHSTGHFGGGLHRLILTNKTVQENTDKQTQYKSEKVDNLKYSRTKLPWFSCLLQHSARKRGGLQHSTTPPSPHWAIFVMGTRSRYSAGS